MTGFFLPLLTFISSLIILNELLTVLFKSQKSALKQLRKLIKEFRHWRKK